MKGWSEVQLDVSQAAGKEREMEFTFDQSFKYDDFFFAGKVVTPLPKPALSSAAASLMWCHGAWDLWARGSFVRKAFGTGFTWRQGGGVTHSAEALYDMKPDGKNKGLFNSPLFLRYGMTFKSQNIVYDLRMQAMNNSLTTSQKSACPIDKNTKLTLSVQEDALAWFSDRKKAFDAFKVGFAVEYKV